MSSPTTFLAALANETATAHLMADLALLIGAGDVITLSGDLGAGKTAAARALIRYLADDETLEVPSPTFTLAQGYELPAFPLVHADLYRVNDARELEEIGLSPLPEGAVALIEWPERAPGALPPDRIDIAFHHRPALGSTARSAEITGYGKAAAQVERLKALRQFLDGAGLSEAGRQRMPGDASIRSYGRLICNDGVVIRLVFPELTQDRRRELVKVVKHRAEEARVAVRNVRRQARHDLEGLARDGDLSENELKRIDP